LDFLSSTGDLLMHRRRFIGSVAAGLLAVPLAAQSQQSDRVRRIGMLITAAENNEGWQAYLAAFRQRLQDLGSTDGRAFVAVAAPWHRSGPQS
jgi:hypothetical protein